MPVDGAVLQGRYHILGKLSDKDGGDPSFRVVRGGSWLINGGNCRSAYRGRSEPGFHDIDLGVRVVVSATTLAP